MNHIREITKGESFDYSILMNSLSKYKSPRAKITHLLRSGELIRIKKGLYIFGPRQRRSMVSLEVLANQIYGPSYVSCEYALAFYGLIPEHVFEVTSVTTKRTKRYETPIGRFSYAPLPTQLFSTGFTLFQLDDHQSMLIATPEKALADLLFIRKIEVNTLSDLEDLLFDDLRLDPTGVKKFRIGVLSDILKAGGNSTLSLIINWLRSNK
jgi:hypothetical protein